MEKKTCECGTVTGEACAWDGDGETVIIEWMPESLRGTHRAAGPSGSWPDNGAQRLVCEESCARWLTNCARHAEDESVEPCAACDVVQEWASVV